MPLLKIAQTHHCLEKHQQAYNFADEHKNGWCKFWKAMDGDVEKVLDFAKKAEISNPEIWVNELHRFLFDVFSGSPKLLKRSSKDFPAFLKQIAENHQKDPKVNWWYSQKGTCARDFIRFMEHAAVIPGDDQIIKYINARLSEFGSKLYSEYLLAKTPHFKEMKTSASELNKKAYKIEMEHGRNRSFKVGQLVVHIEIPDELLEVVEVLDEEDPLSPVMLQDENGAESIVEDVWDLEPVEEIEEEEEESKED